MEALGTSSGFLHVHDVTCTAGNTKTKHVTQSCGEQRQAGVPATCFETDVKAH